MDARVSPLVNRIKLFTERRAQLVYVDCLECLANWPNNVFLLLSPLENHWRQGRSQDLNIGGAKKNSSSVENRKKNISIMLKLKLIHTRLRTVQGLADNPQVISTMRFVRLSKNLLAGRTMYVNTYLELLMCAKSAGNIDDQTNKHQGDVMNM